MKTTSCGSVLWSHALSVPPTPHISARPRSKQVYAQAVVQGPAASTAVYAAYSSAGAFGIIHWQAMMHRNCPHPLLPQKIHTVADVTSGGVPFMLHGWRSCLGKTTPPKWWKVWDKVKQQRSNRDSCRWCPGTLSLYSTCTQTKAAVATREGAWRTIGVLAAAAAAALDWC